MAYKNRPKKKPPLPQDPQVRLILDQIDSAKQQVSMLETALDMRLLQLANERFNSPYKDGELHFGFYECEKSPTSQCVYLESDDPMHDFCLFCEDPEERK